jgi:hypothetical protein
VTVGDIWNVVSNSRAGNGGITNGVHTTGGSSSSFGQNILYYGSYLLGPAGSLINLIGQNLFN